MFDRTHGGVFNAVFVKPVKKRVFDRTHGSVFNAVFVPQECCQHGPLHKSGFYMQFLFIISEVCK